MEERLKSKKKIDAIDTEYRKFRLKPEKREWDIYDPKLETKRRRGHSPYDCFKGEVGGTYRDAVRIAKQHPEHTFYHNIMTYSIFWNDATNDEEPPPF